LCAFDPAFERLSPGKLAFLHAIEAAIAEGCDTFDLLRGDEPYKYDWGARDRSLRRWHLLPQLSAAEPAELAP
jgi:CelD/BcsL family acetyltransferase involved in cellulose biosynthesis